MKLDPQTWRTLSSLLDEAWDVPAQDFARWLASLSRENARLAPMLRELIARRDAPETSGLIDRAPSLTWSLHEPTDDGELEAGDDVGPYRLVAKLGFGGMGVVWQAERRDGLVNRVVALKLPHYAGPRAALAERFRRERDIVASLEHPAIARLYDAGFAADGRPFLALEYVQGAAITDACKARRAPLRERVALFLRVIEAVQFAHSRLVLHRDLKPSNILVNTHGEPKLLDFGIAKLMQDGAAQETELTQRAGGALTPDYASPEQIAGQPLSTASDVYALGVVLYELLTGERPYQLKRGTRGELEEAILREPVERASARVTEAFAASVGAGRARWRKALAGDLDTILDKALRKDPRERYPSAADLAQDLSRFLEGRPVAARPRGMIYRMRKFVARNRLAVGAGASVATVLVAAAAVSLHQARVARSEASRATAVQDFLVEIFRTNRSDQPDPASARKTTALNLLDIGARRIDGALDADPDAKVAMIGVLAEMYDDLGLDDRAVALRKKAVAVLRGKRDADDPALAQALLGLAGSLHASNAVNERGAVLAEVESILDRNGRAPSALRAHLRLKQAEHYASINGPKALSFAQASVALFAQLDEPDGLVDAHFQEASIRKNMADNAGAVKSMEASIAAAEARKKGRSPQLPRLYATLGEAQFQLQDYAGAEASLRAALAAAKAINGEEHVDTIQTEMRLGRFLFDTARTHEGIRLLESARDRALRVRGPDDAFHTPTTFTEYAFSAGRYGRAEDALRHFDRAIANRRDNRPGTLYLGQMLTMSAGPLIDLGRYDEASARILEFESIAAKGGHQRPSLYFNMTDGHRARMLLAQGRVADAEAIVSALHVVQTPGRISTSQLEKTLMTGEVALARGDAAAALALAASVQDEVMRSPLRAYLRAYEMRADALAGRAALRLGDPVRAQAELARSAAAHRDLLDPGSPRIAEVDAALAEAARAASATPLAPK